MPIEIDQECPGFAAVCCAVWLEAECHRLGGPMGEIPRARRAVFWVLTVPGWLVCLAGTSRFQNSRRTEWI